MCVKLRDDIQITGELTGQMMALREQVKARYMLSDLVWAQKNDKMTNHCSKWKRKGIRRQIATGS